MIQPSCAPVTYSRAEANLVGLLSTANIISLISLSELIAMILITMN